MPLSHQLSHPAVAQLPGSCCLAPTPDGHLGPRPQMAIWGASVAIWGASDGYLLHGSDGHLGGALAVFWRAYRRVDFRYINLGQIQVQARWPGGVIYMALYRGGS